MRITFDPAKRQATLDRRGLDFSDAAEAFSGLTFDIPDRRRDYGEDRTITIAFLRDRMVVIVWTPRDGGRRIISMRKANAREQALYLQRFDEG